MHLCDAHYVTDAAKYVSVLMLSLRAMLHLELPHVNVLSKVDLITQYGDLGTSLRFYFAIAIDAMSVCERATRLTLSRRLQP